MIMMVMVVVMINDFGGGVDSDAWCGSNDGDDCVGDEDLVLAVMGVSYKGPRQ